MGNTLVLVTCYRNLKVNRFSLMWYVANLASADLRLTFLTPFNANNLVGVESAVTKSVNVLNLSLQRATGN